MVTRVLFLSVGKSLLLFQYLHYFMYVVLSCAQDNQRKQGPARAPTLSRVALMRRFHSYAYANTPRTEAHL